MADLTRDVLVDAAIKAFCVALAEEPWEDLGWDELDEDGRTAYLTAGAKTVDAVLSRIADAIEDQLTRPYKVPGNPESYFTTTDTWNNAVESAAHRIRSLMGADGGE